ncbi:MAG: ZIP family metal transporter [Patescibacteria group bacterium]
MSFLYPLVSVLAVSLVSFVGLFAISVNTERLKKVIFILISFAAGTLLGDAFLHILPEIVAEHGWSTTISIYLLISIVLFYCLEQFIQWHHYHHVSEEEKHPVGMLNLVGDGFHNFIDGLIIGSSYLVSAELGIATTLAVIFHEIPQEIGDFAILIHSGFTRRKALLYNFFSALTAVLGTLLAVWASARFEGVVPFLLALTAGGFIYIATADLIPELHKEVNIKKSFIQLFSFLCGMGLMYLLLTLE